MSLRDFLTFTALKTASWSSLDYALHWINQFVFSAGIAKSVFVVHISPHQIVIYPLIALSTLRQGAVQAKFITHNVEPCAQELAEGFRPCIKKQTSQKKNDIRYLTIKQSICHFLFKPVCNKLKLVNTIFRSNGMKASCEYLSGSSVTSFYVTTSKLTQSLSS